VPGLIWGIAVLISIVIMAHVLEVELVSLTSTWVPLNNTIPSPHSQALLRIKMRRILTIWQVRIWASSASLSCKFDPRTIHLAMPVVAHTHMLPRGQNLILNMADNGFTICAFNRTVSKVDRFLENEAKGKSVVGAKTVEEFVSKLKSPRRVMLLVQAGQAVDDWIEKILPLLDAGDIIIDGGNSHFPDSNRRTKYLAGKNIRFVGSGVSGGEEGARYGPSLMPGGNEEAWPHIKDIFQSIAAKSDGEACCEWVGDEGAGHYVKMVHNGIEYGDMQLICEV
jgi:hypothetical protein